MKLSERIHEVRRAMNAQTEERIRVHLEAMGLPTDPAMLLAEVERRFPGKELVLETGPVEMDHTIEADRYNFTCRQRVELKLLDKGWRDSIVYPPED